MDLSQKERARRTRQRLLSTIEAAEYLNQSASLLNKLRLSGEGPEFIKLGRSVRYEIEALEAYIASRRRRSTSDADAAPEAA